MNERFFYDCVAGIWLFLSLVTFVSLLWIAAPYGKFTRPGFGPIVDRTLGWIVMELPALLTVPVFFVLGGRFHPVSSVFVLLWVAHYFYRTLVFPFRMRGKKGSIALVAVLLGVVFNLGNGYLNGRYLFFFLPERGIEWFWDIRFVFGAVLFFVGLGINIHSDAVLRNLRKPGETLYRVPQGGIFRFVSSANYLGELIEWTGFAIATWSVGGVIFVIWTAANLVPRALKSHAWYVANFPEYPKERRAIFPFLL